MNYVEEKKVDQLRHFIKKDKYSKNMNPFAQRAGLGGTRQCPNCGKMFKPILGERRRPDLLIQQEFPDAKPFEREQLITGLCSDKCWKEYLGGGE